MRSPSHLQRVLDALQYLTGHHAVAQEVARGKLVLRKRQVQLVGIERASIQQRVNYEAYQAIGTSVILLPSHFPPPPGKLSSHSNVVANEYRTQAPIFFHCGPSPAARHLRTVCTETPHTRAMTCSSLFQAL